MLAAETTRTDPADFELAIERRIHQRTAGRVRQMHVALSPDRVTVRGFTATYYIKQLAIQALMETIGTQALTPVVDIEVT